MICCVPYGALAVTLVYIVFYAILRTNLESCLSESYEACGTEGVDNTSWTWLAQIFSASIIACMSIHLITYNRWFQTTAGDFNRRATVLGGYWLACISLAFVMKGVVHASFGNNGLDDGKGMKGYYISTAVQYTLMGISSLVFAMLSYISTGQWATKVMFLAAANITATFFVVSACFVAATSLPEDFYVETLIDDSVPNPSKIPYSFKLVKTGKGIWNVSYVAFLLAVALVWGGMAKENVVLVMGLPNSLAAAGIIIAQLTGCVLYLLMLALDGANGGQRLSESAAHRSAPFVFEYTALMTAFFAHNLIFSLFSGQYYDHEEKESDGEEYPTDDSYHSNHSSNQDDEGGEENYESNCITDDVESFRTKKNEDVASFGQKSLEGTNDEESPFEPAQENEAEADNCDNHIEGGSQQDDNRIIPMAHVESSGNNDSPHQIQTIFQFVADFLTFSNVTPIENSTKESSLNDEMEDVEMPSDAILTLPSGLTTSAVADVSMQIPMFSYKNCSDDHERSCDGRDEGHISETVDTNGDSTVMRDGDNGFESFTEEQTQGYVLDSSLFGGTNDEILADLHSSLGKEETGRKHNSRSLSKDRLRPRRKKKAKLDRKKLRAQKMLEIPCAIYEQSERIGICQSEAGDVKDSESEASAKIQRYAEQGKENEENVEITSEGNKTHGNTALKVVSIDNLHSMNHDSAVDITCEQNTKCHDREETLGVDERPENDSNPIKNDKETNQPNMSSSSANNGVGGLNCWNESLVALSAALDDKVGPYCNAPFQTPLTHQSNLDENLFNKCVIGAQHCDPSVQLHREPSLVVPAVLQAGTFQSDCVSNLTSDFDETDSGNEIYNHAQELLLDASEPISEMRKEEPQGDEDISDINVNIETNKTALETKTIEINSSISKDKERSIHSRRDGSEPLSDLSDQASNTDVKCQPTSDNPSKTESIDYGVADDDSVPELVDTSPSLTRLEG